MILVDFRKILLPILIFVSRPLCELAYDRISSAYYHCVLEITLASCLVILDDPVDFKKILLPTLIFVSLGNSLVE